MSVLDETNQNDTTEQELDTYLTDIYQKLEAQNSSFRNGDGIYVGSLLLRDFYKGRHWSYRKQGGGTMRTYNYCFTVVENMTAFLANETPEMHSFPRDVSDPIERSRSEAIDQVLSEVHRINRFATTYQKGVRVGAITGASFLFGAVYDSENGVIRYWNIENPENIRPIWKDDNYTEMEGFVNQYRMTRKSFEKQFGKQLKERGIDAKGLKSSPAALVNKPAVGDRPNYQPITNVPWNDIHEMEVQEYYDDTYYMARLVNGSNNGTVLDFFVHDYGFVPGIWIPNIHLPGEAKGTSDVENLLDAQIAYNEAKSNEEDIIRQVAFTQLWGKNLENFTVMNTGMGEVYSFNDEAELNAIPRSANPLVIDNFERAVQGDLINLSGTNQALYPGGVKSVLASTGRALSVLMQGINNKVALRKTFWKEALETLNRNILILVEKKITNGKALVAGNYRTDVFISSVLLRDVTEEINKFNHKLQSMTTTQKNLGIPSPSQEQKLMKEELKDPIFSVEISRQPGLLQAIIQQEIQQIAAANATGNPELAIMGQGEGEPAQAQPIASAQQRSASTTSPEGAVNASSQRKTGAPVAVATR